MLLLTESIRKNRSFKFDNLPKGDKWTMVTATAMKKVELNFVLGQPFEESTADGRFANLLKYFLLRFFM